MKRCFAILLSILLLLSSFAACNEEAESTSSINEISQEESKASQSEPLVNVSIAEPNATPDESSIDESSVDESSEAEESSEPETSTESSAPETSEPEDTDTPNAFRLSSIDDFTDENGTRTYTVFAPYTDTYKIEGKDVKSITVSQNGEKIKKGSSEISVSLKANQIYTLAVTTKKANADFTLTTTAENHKVTLPYDVAAPTDTSKFDVNGNSPLVPSKVDYIKREGGTYVYSNNPEQFGSQHVGKAFMRNEGLTGEVYVTFEHANYSGSNAYLGYQLKNDTDHDVYITVTNVGYQWIGTWFGQLAWYKFYNTSFTLPSDYFNANGSISSKYSGLDYAYIKNTPRVYQPTTYRLPAGEKFWVIGGTTSDSYRNINVDGSANRFVNPIRCANGNVKFTVTGGEVTGTMYCYSNPSQIANDPEPIGYVAAGYAQQYSGIAYHHGVIDNYMEWTFGDNDKSGYLPVTYTSKYADSVPSYVSPYSAYNSTDHTVAKSNTWMTHLNPQNDHRAVGMDMVEFIWHDQNGKEIVIDNHHADGAGAPANTANWMIEYQDHFTFVNQGDKERTVTLHLRDHGTLALLVRDSKTGEVLEASYTAGLGENGNVFSNYTYTLTIPAHSIKQITLDYLLVACSYGSVMHAVQLK